MNLHEAHGSNKDKRQDIIFQTTLLKSKPITPYKYMISID